VRASIALRSKGEIPMEEHIADGISASPETTATLAHHTA
jgi:hypothetical protein